MRIRPGEDYTHRLVYIVALDKSNENEGFDSDVDEIKQELLMTSNSGHGEERFSLGFSETEIQEVIKDSGDLNRLM